MDAIKENTLRLQIPSIIEAVIGINFTPSKKIEISDLLQKFQEILGEITQIINQFTN